MTTFDLILAAAFLVSGLIGRARGATREVTTVVAFVLSVVAAILALRFSAPMARHFIHTAWLAEAAALVLVFVAVYVVLRLIGGRITRGVRQTVLSGPDRALGFLIGLVRTLVVLGVFVLLIRAATPPERMPAWLLKSRAWPLANAAGDGLRALAPKGLDVARRIAPSVADALAAPAAANDQADSKAPAGYSRAQRRALDDLVEKARQ